MAVNRNVVVEHPLADRLKEYYGVVSALEDVGVHCELIRTAIQQGDSRLVGALWAAALQLYFRCFNDPWDRITGDLAKRLPPLHGDLKRLRNRYYAHADCELEDNRVTTIVPADPPPGWSPSRLGRRHAGFGGFMSEDSVSALEELALELRTLLQPEIQLQEVALLEALRQERTAEDWRNAPIVRGKAFSWASLKRPLPRLGHGGRG